MRIDHCFLSEDQVMIIDSNAWTGTCRIGSRDPIQGLSIADLVGTTPFAFNNFLCLEKVLVPVLSTGFMSNNMHFDGYKQSIKSR